VRDARILVFGATGGIGRALCARVAASGARLVIAARGRDRLDALAAETGATAMEVDATDADAVARVCAGAAESLGGLDGVVSLVGSILLKPAQATTIDDWKRTIDLNLNSAFYVVKGAVPRMMASGGGSIVLMGSAVALHGFPAHEAVAAAKAGVIGLARATAASYAKRGVRVNVVSPGLTDTPLAATITGSEPALKASIAMHADGKIGTAEQVASAIAWVLDPMQAHVTGQNIAVDGGLGSLCSK
jgi:NAD(P)-dependent dehydrogenase (short-subunit alcohol dehydrogenase family)